VTARENAKLGSSTGIEQLCTHEFRQNLERNPLQPNISGDPTKRAFQSGHPSGSFKGREERWDVGVNPPFSSAEVDLELYPPFCPRTPNDL
jgi:hypothetical protein